MFSQLNKEFLIFLFFLLLSGVFWLMMTLNETYEQEVCVPVRLVGVPKNVVITTDIQDTVKVTVRDKGYTLAAYLYGDRISPVSINFQTYANKHTGYAVVPAADLQKMIYQRLSGSSKITAVKPDKADFYFNYGLSKTVPVRLSGTITPDKSYYLSRTHIIPDSVTVYANQHQLDSIKYVSTEALYIVDFADTVKQDVRLAKITGAKTVPAKVRVELYPDILTEESLEVPIRAVNMPEGKVLRMFPSRVKVRFTVGASMFRSVKPAHFLVVADYDELSAHPSSQCRLQLRTVPHGVRNARLEIQQVDYLIEQQ